MPTSLTESRACCCVCCLWHVVQVGMWLRGRAQLLVRQLARGWWLLQRSRVHTAGDFPGMRSEAETAAGLMIGQEEEEEHAGRARWPGEGRLFRAAKNLRPVDTQELLRLYKNGLRGTTKELERWVELLDEHGLDYMAVPTPDCSAELPILQLVIGRLESLHHQWADILLFCGDVIEFWMAGECRQAVAEGQTRRARTVCLI